jgi:diguanylate cyclase (GGDEF)-like protein
MAVPCDSPTLLLATEDGPLLEEARHAFERIGWRVAHVRDEPALWAQWERNRPSLVILALGEESQRPQLCGEALTRFAEVPAPVIVATRQLSDALIRSAYDAGAADVIGMPVRWQTLLPRIERLTSPQPASDESGGEPAEESARAPVEPLAEVAPAPDPPAAEASEVRPSAELDFEELRTELERSRVELENVQRIAGLGTWTYDFRSGHMRWSNQTYKILGLPSDDIATFESLSMCLHPRDREAVVDAFMSATAGGMPLNLICRVVLPSGGVRHIQIRGAQPSDGSSVMPGTLQDVTEQQRSQDKIRQLAHYDGLTGLSNRRRFMEQLKKAGQRSAKSEHKMALLYMDLDQFKRVNDTLGHSAGDELLCSVAQTLFDKVRVTDVVGRPGTSEDPEISRIGGDEFAILLTEVGERDDAQRVAERILKALPTPILVDGHEISTTGSIGIAIHPDDGEDMETLLKHADRALYHAKESGRNTYKFFTESLNSGAMKRLTMESRLRSAIENGGLKLRYQPRFELENLLVVGVEALARWHDEELGQVSPKDFIVVAEETGLIEPLGFWALVEACSQSVRWQRAGMKPVPVSVNVSTAQFRRDELITNLAHALETTGLDPTLLEIEITESLMLQDDEKTATTLREIRAMGIRVALDDFGTGYSSLSYLARYPLDLLKLDRSLVRDLSSDPHAQGIATAVISMAHVLGLRVVAEGVDQQGILDFLKQQGCDEVQGFLLSEALEPSKIAQFLELEEGAEVSDPREDSDIPLLAMREPIDRS